MRLVQITPGITILVAFNPDLDGRVVAVHHATHTVVVEDTEQDALDKVREVLLADREWYCYGRGAEMMLHGEQYRRKMAVQSIFGCSVRENA